MAKTPPPRHEVAEFLNQFRVAVDYGMKSMRSREKNTQGLIDLGITERQAWETVQQLTPDDYMAGPKPDDTEPDKEVWEFGKNINDTEAYIKLRLTPASGKRNVFHALIWSFHPAEFPVRYPLREERS